MKKGRFFLSLLTAVVMVFSAFSVPLRAEEESESETEHPSTYFEEIQSNEIPGWPQGEAVNADAAVLIDAETGAVLYAKDIEQELPPASITKIMTTLLALENGKLDDVVKFSEYAVYSIEYGSSHLGMTEGEELTLEQCLYGVMLASANEISNAVAEHIGGSVKNFADMMNERAQELGCTHTHFVNAHGLTEDNHYVCALDMARIMREALKNQKFREIIGTVEYQYPKTNLVDEERYFMNHHKMIAEEGMLYDGCIGGKNGFTDEAGNTLVTAAERDGLTLIAVVLNVPGLYVSYDDTKTLLDYGFANFKSAQVTNENTADLEITGIDDPDELARIRKADILKKPFSMVGSTQVTLPAGVETSELQRKMDFATNTLSYSYEGQVLGSVPFTYTKEWEPETEQTQAESETDPLLETSGAVRESGSLADRAREVLGKAAEFVSDAYNKMDAFIEENTLMAAVIGAVLLLIFIPLLILAISRSHRYQRIQKLREEDLRERMQLEQEIERKSAAQVEAELRARELQARLEEEQRKNRAQREEPKASSGGQGAQDAVPVTQRQVSPEGRPVSERGRALSGGQPVSERGQASLEGQPVSERVQASPEGQPAAYAPEDEYIEVPLEEGAEPMDSFTGRKGLK